MINLIPIIKLISSIAISYGLLVAIIVWISFDPTASLWSSVRWSLAGATMIELLLLGVIYVWWRQIWQKIPLLNNVIFPDLNGTWDMTINWTHANGNSDIVHAIAHIKQDFLKISMDVDSPKSYSETLMAKPKKHPESGFPILYYIYRNIPKQINGHSGISYEGSAILNLDHKDFCCLKGNYFTNAYTRGYFELSKIME
jgi:hypothetical protein